jgi:hypothetical protein
MAFRHRGRENLPLGIDANVQFLPALVLLLPVFLRVPFPLTADFQTRTVDDQINGFLCGTLDVLADDYHGIASRERRMIGALQRHAHQRQDGMEKAFRLPQGQAKEQPERECGLNGHVRIDERSPPLSSLRRCPGIDSVLTHPQGDITTIA